MIKRSSQDSITTEGVQSESIQKTKSELTSSKAVKLEDIESCSSDEEEEITTQDTQHYHSSLKIGKLDKNPFVEFRPRS